jgi:protein MpaA
VTSATTVPPVCPADAKEASRRLIPRIAAVTSLITFITARRGIGVRCALAALGLLVALPVVAAYAVPGPPKRQSAGPVGSLVLGQSLRGRPIALFERGDPNAPYRVLVVGCIHGDEKAGLAVTRRLETISVPPELDLWVIPSANPDGVAQGTRTNGRGVDLNRNFPWHWRPIGRVGDPHHSGTGPLSEPETRLLVRTIDLLRPDVTIWFHQPFGIVDESGGEIAVERRFARLAGMTLRRLPRYAGGVTNWQNANFPGTTAFVVELPGGPLTARRADRLARAVVGLAPVTS